MSTFRFPLMLLVALLALSAACNKKGSSLPPDSFYIDIGGEPSTLNPITSNDAYQQAVEDLVVQTLLVTDSDTYEWKPSAAQSWEISADKKVFTYKLYPDLTFHDGKPLTAEDVKFSFDVIFDPKYNTAHIRPYYESIAKVEVVDPHTVKFHVKDDYFMNFYTASTLAILPKHFYGDEANKDQFNKTILGSGPYKFAKHERGKRIVLEKFEKWSGELHPTEVKQYQVPKMVLRFLSDQNVALETFKKGELDLFGMTPETFIKKTSGDNWGSTLIKVQTENKSPKGYNFIGWNLQNPLFTDKNVRKALAMLFNRPLVREKFEYNMTEPATGPIYFQSDYAPTGVEAVPFDPAGASALLAQAGWKDTDGDGVLDKVIKGEKFRMSFTILEPSEEMVRYLTIYKDDAKKIGVDINIKNIEWNSFIKLLDERKFEGVRLAWGRGTVDVDLKQIWHSASIAGGSNFIGFNNAKVDKLIDEARKTYDREKRIQLTQQAAKLIAEEYPYVFFTNNKFTLYAHNKRIQKPKDTFVYALGTSYWTISKE